MVMQEITREINGKLIVIGDTHFGLKRFSIDTLKDQLSLFENQIFPYMEENNITEIFQLGDLFDNRTSTDINFIHTLKELFFDKLKEKGILLHALVGNHDIYFRESREVTLVKFFRDLYPDNFILYEDRTYININNNKTYIVPWITKDEDFVMEEISDCHNVLGHFEIRHFALVKGHMDENAKLTSEFFTENTKVKNVFSGHYHIKDTNKLVKYLGTPWQNNYSDYDEEKGFYVWDEDDFLEFHENTSSRKYIKIKYNDEQNTDRNIEVSGLFKHRKLLTDEEYKELLPTLEKHEIKFFINKAKDRHYDEILYTMKEAGVNSTVINNEELSSIIGTDYIQESEVGIDTSDTRTLITEAVKTNKEELIPLLVEIFNDIDRTINKEL
jgi:hypothetical protein